MKKIGAIISIIVEVSLIAYSLIKIVVGMGETYDYFYLIGLIVICILDIARRLTGCMKKK